MTRRTVQINRPASLSRRRSLPRPTCESVRPETGQRCVLDPEHGPKHFADGVEWEDVA